MRDETFFITIGILLTIVFLIIGFVIHNDTRPNYEVCLNQCKEKGGVPSEYEVKVNKSTHREYLCIKPDAIIK